MLGSREDLAWLCWVGTFCHWGGKGKQEHSLKWPIPSPFFFISHGDGEGQRVYINPNYNEIPTERSCMSCLVPCWLVPCWSCLLASEAAWRHMYPQRPGTVWSPALYSWRAPHLTAENREQDRDDFNYISTLWGGHTLRRCPAVATQIHPDLECTWLTVSPSTY